MNLKRFLGIFLIFNLSFGNLIGSVTAIEYYQKAQEYYLVQNIMMLLMNFLRLLR